jgi:hypothetical protein
VRVSGWSKHLVMSATGQIMSRLGDLAGAVEVMDRVPWDYEDAPLPTDEEFRPLRPRENESPEQYRSRSHAFFDEIFKAAVDREIPELRDRTPQELARSKTGRKQLVKWLNGLEEKMRKQGAPFDDYDLIWFWTELGIAEHRQARLFE